jgi:transcriptional regulator PpsR
MSGVSIAQPDVTLLLDLEGVIQKVTLADAWDEDVDAWLGRPWVETVGAGGERVSRMVEDARASGVSGFRQVTQLFPSGRELPMEYTTVRLGAKAGLIAVGKNLQAVAELQSRLIAAQEAMERDYWKLREIETRYRLLFDAANEAVVLLRAADLRVVEANPAAIRALGLAPIGREFLAELAARDRQPFQAMLLRVREYGKAPGILVRLGQTRQPWLVRASLIAAEPGTAFLLQLAPAGASRPAFGHGEPVFVDDLIERMPDGFAVTDRDGVVLRANRALLDLIQVGAEGSATGEHLRRWLGRPGADVPVLIDSVHRHGSVRLFPTTIHGEQGLDTEVEISAVGDADSNPRHVAVLFRDTSRRLAPSRDDHRLGLTLDTLAREVGKTSLRELVRGKIGVVERLCIEAALDQTRGNRTAAAELLGLSRQSLYAKLGRYGLDGGGDGAEPSLAD